MESSHPFFERIGLTSVYKTSPAHGVHRWNKIFSALNAFTFFRAIKVLEHFHAKYALEELATKQWHDQEKCCSCLCHEVQLICPVLYQSNIFEQCFDFWFVLYLLTCHWRMQLFETSNWKQCLWLKRLHQCFPNIFVRGTLQGYFMWTRNPHQICHENINAFFTRIAVTKASYCKQNYAQ